jgi:PKD repeat protein
MRIALLLVLLSCKPTATPADSASTCSTCPTGSDPTDPTDSAASETEDTTDTDPPTETGDAAAWPVAVATVDVDAGEAPLTVHLSATESVVAAGPFVASWDLGGGLTAEGDELDHVFDAIGAHLVLLTVTDSLGRTDDAAVAIAVYPATCPVSVEPLELGTLAEDEVDEASGVVASRQSPGVLWTHNDSGGGPELFAFAEDGSALGTYTLQGVTPTDWEDIALGEDPATGAGRLYVGDIGDNARARETITVWMVDEPVVDPLQEHAEVTLKGVAELTLRYPKEVFDAEAIMVDPRTEDVYVVTKDRTLSGYTGIFRKAAPHADGDDAVLEEVASLNFMVAPLVGVTVTGSDISPNGEHVVIRTYSTQANVWLRSADQSIAEALAGPPCPIELPSEDGLAEAVGFSPDGAGLYTLAEGDHPPVRLTPLE